MAVIDNSSLTIDLAKTDCQLGCRLSLHCYQSMLPQTLPKRSGVYYIAEPPLPILAVEPARLPRQNHVLLAS